VSDGAPEQEREVLGRIGYYQRQDRGGVVKNRLRDNSKDYEERWERADALDAAR